MYFVKWATGYDIYCTKVYCINWIVQYKPYFSSATQFSAATTSVATRIYGWQEYTPGMAGPSIYSILFIVFIYSIEILHYNVISIFYYIFSF